VAIIRKPEPAEPDQRRLFDELHELHLRAGAPSVRAIERLIGTLSRDTVYRVLAGPTVPGWPATEAVVRALDGDPERFRVLWMAAHRPATTPAAAEPATGDVVDEPITVLIVEDHPLYRVALTTALGQAGCTIVGAVDDGAAAVELALTLLPDVVLMDLKLPKLGGIEATKEIVRARPTVRVLVLTGHGSRDTALEALTAGATGFLTKDADLAEILAAVRAVHKGQVHLSERVLGSGEPVRARPSPPVRLNHREQEVLRLVAAGERDADIAESMGLSIRMVRSYLDTIRDRTGLRRRPDLTRYAVDQGLAAFHRTIFAVNMAEAPARPDPALRDAMYHLVEAALRAGGIRSNQRDPLVDRGAGLLVLIRPVDGGLPARLLTTVIPTLDALLTAYRDNHPDRPLRLRAVLHAGAVRADARGPFGEALDVAFRLLDAREPKASSGLLAVVVSGSVHHSAGRRDVPGFEPLTAVMVGGTRPEGWWYHPGDRPVGASSGTA
jgi:DNA-binding NarL/FixJ family response regulator